MKKKLLFCLAALGTASMLFGFDNAQTADGVLEKMQEAVAENPPAGEKMDMDMDINLSLDIDDGTTSSSIGVGASGNFTADVNTDPAAMSMDGVLNLSLMGQNQSMTMKMYGITSEDGSIDTYIYSEDSVSGEEGTWTHQSSSMPNLDELLEKTSDIDYSAWGIDFELAPEAEDVGGTECYLLSAVMDSSSFTTILNKIKDMSGDDSVSDENLEMVTSMLEGIKINLEYYVDTATYFPVKFHMDMNDSDLSALSQYLAMSMGEMAEGSSVDLVLNNISVDAAVTYGDANEIAVPEEALEAPEADVSEDSEEVLEEVENVLGGTAG